MQCRKSAKEINLELLTLQQQWYDSLPVAFKDRNRYSSPFCCGVSDLEWDDDKPMLMYVGEEARGWWFDAPDVNLAFLQNYSLSYFERQVCDRKYQEKEAEEKYGIAFGKKNQSPFWGLARQLKRMGFNLCWNNVDKIHGIKGEGDCRRTVPLCVDNELALHSPFIPTDHPSYLLLQEIQIIQPDVLVFMGGAYERSIAAALGVEVAALGERPRITKGRQVLVSDISNILPAAISWHPKALWINHPAATVKNVCGRNFYWEMIEEIKEILEGEKS